MLKKREHQVYLNITGSKEEKEYRKRANKTIDLDFYGVPVKLHVNSTIEVKQWSYFFKQFIALQPQSSPVYEFWVGLEDTNCSFIESIHRKDGKMKYICIASYRNFILWSRFENWSNVPSPIPPFNFPPFNQDLVQLSASSVGYNNKGVTFLAEPYQGKSTLANALIQRGAFPLADNVTVYSHALNLILPYLTPTGIRHETLDKISELASGIKNVPEDRITISEVTGKVYLLHFDELFVFPPPKDTPPNLCIYLINERNKMGSRFEVSLLKSKEHSQLLSTFVIENGMNEISRQHCISQLANQTKGIILRYNLSHCCLNDIVDDVIQRLQ